MKPKRRIISFLLAICLVAGLMPTAAFAAGTGTGKAIQLVDSGTAANIRGGQADNIYFGKWAGNPIKWRVLDDHTNTEGSGLFLLSDVLLGKGSSGDVYFNNSGNKSAAWQNSTAQKWCETFYNDNFSAGEQGAVLATTKSDGEFTSTCSAGADALLYAASKNILNGDKVFFLSAEEAENSAYGFTYNTRKAYYGNSPWVWWLRSPFKTYPGYAGGVLHGGHVSINGVGFGCAARPAFNLDLSSVLFTSAAVGGKIPAASSGGNQGGEAADAIFKIGDYDGNEWKLTLLDNSRKFAIFNATANSSDGTIAFSYSGAQTGTNEYISAVVKDNGAITHYGRILQLDGTKNGKSGTASLVLPTGVTLDNDTKLYVFNEQYNGGENDNTKLTDYASNLIAVNVDTTVPTLTASSVSRESDTNATVKFTSDEAGTYYYSVVDSGENEPDVDTTETGTACDTTEQTISLTSLGAGAKDIYIVVKDAAGNISDKLKIEIPAYVAPRYGISAGPSTLDFGRATEGYSSAPAAQTVTITNTGNQTINLNQPRATDFNIDTLSTTELTAGGTATFTVQPKTGLAAGSHSETLTISGSNGTSASVTLAFTVTAQWTANGTTTPTVNASSGIDVWYNGGNSFGTSKSAVPTAVEIDGVPVSFTGNGSEFTVGCISPNAKRVTVNWNSTSVTTNFTPDANAYCTQVQIPKTGDMSFWTAIAEFFGF